MSPTFFCCVVIAAATLSLRNLLPPLPSVLQDPRWGRLQETPGECPVLSAAYAALFVGGFQNTTDPTATGAPSSGTAGASSYVQASSCCKHFAAYSEENWHGLDRFHFDAEVTPQEWADTYLPAFQACIVHGHASGLMCSYNAVNGVPACANPHLLTVRQLHTHTHTHTHTPRPRHGCAHTPSLPSRPHASRALSQATAAPVSSSPTRR